VSSVLSDGKALLRLALSSLIESIRNEPVKYHPLIYYNMSSSLTTTDYLSIYSIKIISIYKAVRSIEESKLQRTKSFPI
jgi:hypothetical protein